MAIKISKTFCVKPFNEIYIGVDGKFKFCCVDSGRFLESIPADFDISNTEIVEVFNNHNYQYMRLMLLNDKIPDTCKKCFYNDDGSSTQGPRIDLLNAFKAYGKKQNQQEYYQEFKNLMSVKNIQNIELWFENKCNLKCRMCNPYCSDQLVDEWAGMINSNEWMKQNLSTKQIQKNKNWVEDPNSWNNLFNLIKEITRDNTDHTLNITMAGGEPFLSDGMYRILDFCIDQNISNQVMLCYKTNLTILPQKLIDRWKHFKHVKVEASADGYEKTFEYIRYPASWKKFVENIKRLKNIDNVSILVHPTIQAYNVLSITDLYQWCVDLNIPFSRPTCVMYNPKILNVKVLPIELKKIAAERLLNFYFKNRENQNLKNRSQDQYIWLIKYMLSEDLSIHFKDFVDFTHHVDKTRNQNILEIIPELEKYL